MKQSILTVIIIIIDVKFDSTMSWLKLWPITTIAYYIVTVALKEKQNCMHADIMSKTTVYTEILDRKL